MNKLTRANEAIRTFLSEVMVEMKKVSWPNWQELKSFTITVLVATVIISIIIGIEDKLLGYLLQKFLDLSSKS